MSDDGALRAPASVSGVNETSSSGRSGSALEHALEASSRAGVREQAAQRALGGGNVLYDPLGVFLAGERAVASVAGSIEDASDTRGASPDETNVVAHEKPAAAVAASAVRHRAIDDVILRECASARDGVRQVVVINAGFGTRPYRLALPDVTWFEVDAMEVQQALGPLMDKKDWSPDAEARECEGEGCNVVFSMYWRRHHCRSCGGVFCANCAPKAAVRLCTACNGRVKAKAGEGHGAEPVPMDMAVFHALAQVLQPDLDEEAPDDPESSATIRREGLWKKVEKTEAEQEGSAEGQEQGKLTAQAVPHGFSHGGAEDGDEKQGKSGHHEAWAYRMSRGLSPGVQSARS